jgi:hypothetical protein
VEEEEEEEEGSGGGGGICHASSVGVCCILGCKI